MDKFDLSSDGMIQVPDGFRSGYVAIAGLPNSGKSTFLNAVLGSHLSIATHKAQTTRHRITGIHSTDKTQVVFLDTPGMLTPKYKLHESMMRAVERSLNDADMILLLADPHDLPEKEMLEFIQKYRNKPVLLAVNKKDVRKEETITKALGFLTEELSPAATFVMSAVTKEGLEEVLAEIQSRLPEGPPFYPPDQISEYPQRFFAAELIREQVFLQYHEEIPYSVTVQVVHYEERDDLDYIDAEIVVNRTSQKGIIIGKKGSALKKLGTKARESIEEFIGKKVYLNLHVKVREKWRDKDGFIRSFGYE